MVKFRKVNSENIRELYDINLELAKCEGQELLFTAKYDDYKSAFISNNSNVYGVLCYGANDELAGFYLYTFKFASYIGSRVLYVEDLYLKEEYSSAEHKMSLIKYIVTFSRDIGCRRTEMRVLHNFNIGTDLLIENDFQKISKWDVYRVEL